MEMKQAITKANKTFLSCKTSTKNLIPGEEEDRLIMRRSIYASRNIKAGSILKASDISFKRPYIGLNANDSNLLIGKRIKKNICFDQPIRISDCADKN